jgi:hypothetical protein
MSPKDRAKVKSIIDKDLPPHYRTAIQGYLKKGANRVKKTTTK